MQNVTLRRFRCTGIVLTSVALTISGAQVRAKVIPDSIIWLPSSGFNSNYSGSLGGTQVGFAYSGNTLRFAFTTLDEGSDWYLANEGDVFSAATIAANQFTVIIRDDPLLLPGPVSIPLGNFYLGVITGDGFTNGHPNRDIFGWIQLNNTGTELLPLASAVAYNEPGIIIGTTTPAPEPATLLLLAPLSLLLARRSKTPPPRRRELS